MWRKPVESTPFIPIPFPTPKSFTIQDISHLLRRDNRPLVIFFTRKKLDLPNPEELPFEAKIIRIPHKRIPDGPEFYVFKDYVYEFLYKNNKDLIGIACNKGNDMSGYIIARWLIEEKGFTLQQALDRFNKVKPPGIAKQKYLDSLKSIYTEESIPSAPEGYPYPQIPPTNQQPYSPRGHYPPQYPSPDGRRPPPLSQYPPPPLGPYPPAPTSPYAGSPISPYQSGPIPTPPYSPSRTGSYQYPHQPPYPPPDRNISPNAHHSVRSGRHQHGQPPRGISPPNISHHVSYPSNEFKNLPPPPPKPRPPSFPLEMEFDSSAIEKSHAKATSEKFRLDPLLASIGRSVDSRKEEEIRSECYLLLGLNKHAPLFPPLIKLTRNGIRQIRNDGNNCYNISPQPDGIRCLLFVRGGDQFIIGENHFMRQISLYLPENERTTQTLTSTIIEGIIALEEDSTKVRFYLVDLYFLEGDNIGRRSYDTRMGFAHQKILGNRKYQRTHKMNEQLFKTDSVSLEVRPPLRLKYFEHTYTNPQNHILSKLKGIVFTPKNAPLDLRPGLSFIWSPDEPTDLTVQLTYNVSENLFEGSCYENGLLSPTVTFGPMKDEYKKYEDKLVDIWFNPETGKWEIKGISKGYKAIGKRDFIAMVVDPSMMFLTFEEMKKHISEFIKLPIYLNEERSKKH